MELSLPLLSSVHWITTRYTQTSAETFHVTIEHKALFEGVQLVQRVVDTKKTLPVLSHILLETQPEANTLTLVATNLELGMTTTLPMIEGAEGSITIPAQRLFHILRELPDVPVTLRIDENNGITLECSEEMFILAGFPKADFPVLPTPPSQEVLVFQQPLLREMVAKTWFAVSHDKSRFVLTGMLFSVQPQELTMVATDGHRLAMMTKPFHLERGATPVEAIIPVNALTEVKNLCDTDASISVHVGEKEIAFQKNGTTLISRRIQAQFPNYRKVIPTASQYVMTVDKERLRRAIWPVALASGASGLVKFTFSNQQLVLSAHDPNLGEIRKSLPAGYTGDAITIGFYARYVLDFLAVANGENVRIGLNDPLGPGLFTSDAEEDSGFSYVIMPMRLE